MFKSRYGNVLTVILVMVIVLILGLVGWFAYDMYKQNSANNKAHSAVEDFNKNVKKNAKDKVKDDELEGSGDFEIGNRVTSNNAVLSNKRTYLENYEIKGVIKIPKTGIEYPILSQVTPRSLELAVAILYGPGLNEVGNTIILGHNYRNSLFFSDNDKLSNGDKILITDQSGETVTYEIYKIYQAGENDSDYMTRDTENRREISLSTCTDDSKARIVIWAKEKVSNNSQNETENEDENYNEGEDESEIEEDSEESYEEE